VTAGVTVPACNQLLRLGDARDLRQARQRIVFAKDRNHRPAVARLAHDRRRDAGQIVGDAETLLFQHRPMLGRGSVFRVGDLGRCPHAVG